MSIGPVSGMVQNGLLAQLVTDSQTTQTQLDKLTQQSASGQVAQTYGGLGNAAPVSIDLRPQMAQVQAWQQNISMANTTLDTTQNVLSQLQSIATSFSSQTLSTAMQSASGAAAVAVQAQSALQQVEALLNTQSGGQYVFAGTDSTDAPVGAGLSSWATSAGGAGNVMAGLGNGIGAAALVVQQLVAQTSTLNLAAPGTPQPAGPAAVAVQTQTGDGQTVPTAFVAGTNSFAPAAASPSTGSYIRDLIAGLSGLANLTSTTASTANLQSFGVAVSQLLQGAGTAIGTEEAGFGQIQSELTTRTSALSDTLTSLTTQVSGAENVDMAATATALSQVQTQLQASFQLIAGLKQLSLTNYL